MFLRFFEKNIKERIKTISDIRDFTILSGSYDFTHGLLDILDEQAPRRFTSNDILKGIEMFKHLLPSNVGKLGLPEPWACASIKVKKDSFSGYMSSRIFGHNKE